jgi:hypothetical protein
LEFEKEIPQLPEAELSTSGGVNRF